MISGAARVPSFDATFSQTARTEKAPGRVLFLCPWQTATGTTRPPDVASFTIPDAYGTGHRLAWRAACVRTLTSAPLFHYRCQEKRGRS